jgi:molybdopterin molybdotransferase
VYALPGNPVSTLVCLVRYVLAGLETAQGMAPNPDSVELAESFEAKPALTLFVPVKVLRGEERRRATLKPTRGSGDFTSLIDTDGFVELPPGPAVVPTGTRVPLYSW